MNYLFSLEGLPAIMAFLTITIVFGVGLLAIGEAIARYIKEKRR